MENITTLFQKVKKEACEIPIGRCIMKPVAKALPIHGKNKHHKVTIQKESRGIMTQTIVSQSVDSVVGAVIRVPQTRVSRVSLALGV